MRKIGADVLICSPLSSAGRTSGWRLAGRGARDLAPVQGPARRRPARSARRFETGTLPYELLAGFNATIDYLDSIGGFDAIVPYERALGERFLDGISDAVTSTVCPAWTAACRPSWSTSRASRPRTWPPHLATQGSASGRTTSWYSLNLYKRLGYADAVRIGFIHYNSAAEVDPLAEALNALAA